MMSGTPDKQSAAHNVNVSNQEGGPFRLVKGFNQQGKQGGKNSLPQPNNPIIPPPLDEDGYQIVQKNNRRSTRIANKYKGTEITMTNVQIEQSICEDTY